MVKAGFRRKDIRGVLKASFLIAIGTLLVSCKNPLYEKQDSQNQTEKVKVCISTDLLNKKERSVLPTNEFDQNTPKLKWTLVGSLQNGVQNKLLGVWEDSNEKTAYQKMTSAEADSEILLDVGIWNFTLTVTTEIDSIEKNVLVGTKNNVEISATKENTLFFKMKAASGEEAANGKIEFLLKFPENIISKAEVSLFSYSEAGIAKKPLGTYPFSADEGTLTISQVSFNESVAPGTYLLKIGLFQKDFSTATHTYSCIVNVVPLLKSSGEVTLSNLAQLYKIEYQLNGGTFCTATTYPNAYNSYTTFELPTVTREGYTFIGWFKGEEKIERTEYSISEDTVLTAKWAKNVEIGSQGNPYTNWSQLKEYLETSDTTESTIYIAGEMTATEEISVARPVTIKSVGEVKIIKGTSNIFNFESDTSFSLIGTENNRIILDGNSTEDNDALIKICDEGGDFVFDYCTFQNAIQTYSSEAAVLHAEGFSKITMNNCIITNNQANSYIIYLKNESDESNFELNNCEISENVSATTYKPLILQIAYCGQVKIYNTKFDQNSNSEEGLGVFDIYVDYVPLLLLNGTIQIPNLYFNNSRSGVPQPYSLDIQIEKDFSLLNEKIPICVEVFETTAPTTGTRDLELFDLKEGQKVPENVFVLANNGYQINAETGEIEEKINSPQTGELIEANDFVYVEGSTISTVLNPTGGVFDGKEITIRSLYVCNHEVTQKEYTTYCEYGASDNIPSVNGVGDNYPVYFVNFFDALAYCNNRSIAENLTPCYTINDSKNPENWGTVPSSSTDIADIWANENIICDFEATGYRLLTEEEWEYVARGGKNLDTFEYSGSNTFTDVGFSNENCEINTDGSTKMTSEIKQKATNSLGIYDMSGNVGEWTWGIKSTTNRYVRGGSILQASNKCTVYERSSYGSYSRNYYTGFRICRNA